MMETPLTVSAENLGTSEALWLGSSELAACPEMRWSIAPFSRVVVVAPHPDDEILAVGGMLRLLARTYKCELCVVAVTDGEASHPRSPTCSPGELRERRAKERAVAFEKLGVSAPETVRLGVPDGNARGTNDLSERLQEPLRGAALCFAPWSRDGHPDHDASGRAAIAACEQMNIPLLSYPVWAWHWARPNSHDLPWNRVRRISIDAETRAAKQAAIEAYASQIAPLGSAPGDEAILPPAVLARFRRSFEVVFA